MPDPGSSSDHPKKDPAISAGAIIALSVIVLLVIGGIFFRQEIVQFLRPFEPPGALPLPAGKMEGTIQFGKAINPSGRSVQEPTTTFYLDEKVAWVVEFEKGVGTRELIVVLFEIAPDGSEVPLDRNKMTMEPTDHGLYNYSEASAFWSLSPEEPVVEQHTYRVKYLKDGRPVAQGDFTIIDPSKVTPKIN